MKKIIVLCVLLLGYGVVRSQTSDTLTLKTASQVGHSFSLTFNMGAMVSIDWGDGVFEDYASVLDSISGTLRGDKVKVVGSNITLLDCSSDNVVEMDVSKLPNLATLDCSHNNLTAIGLTANVKLQKLNCSYNNLQSLSTGSCPLLTDLIANNNQLNQLSFASSALLTNLVINDNKLSALNFTGLTGLKTLWCQNNTTENIDARNSVLLQTLLCYNNQLKTLQLDGLTSLTQLWCDTNKVSSLNLSTNTSLKYLSANNAGLFTLSLAKPVATQSLYLNDNSLPFSSLPSAGSLTDYVYSPQDLFPITTTTKFVVDLSAQLHSFDNTPTNPSFKWYNESTLLQAGSDYTEQSGVFTFNGSFMALHCEMSSSVFPGLTLTSTTIPIGDYAAIVNPEASNNLILSSKKGILKVNSLEAQTVVVRTVQGDFVKRYDRLLGQRELTLPAGIYTVNRRKVVVF